MKQRIVLVTTWFPPQQSVATNRMLSFVEFLSEDFTIEVICIDDKAHQIDNWKSNINVHYLPSNKFFDKLKSNPKDHKLVHKLKTGLKVLLLRVVKNPLDSWTKKASLKLAQVHQQKPIDLIISSFSPEACHIAVIDFFKTTNSSIPWIADMRDEMSTNPYLSESQISRLKAVELGVNKYASAITSVSDPIIQDFKVSCTNISNFLEIRNGYNHTFHRDISKEDNRKVFTIGYFGSFYGLRKPDYLFRALLLLRREQPSFNFEMEIVGAHSNFDVPNELASFVHMNEGLPYNDGIEMMADMHLNCVMHPASKQKGVFTGKLFDYISVQRPVLALVDLTDVAAKLVRDFECGYVAEFDDVKMIKEQIWQAFQDWKNKDIKIATNDDKNSLHRSFQVQKLNGLIHQLIGI